MSKIKAYFKGLPSLTKFIIFSFAVILIYSVAELIISTTSGISHDTLTTCLYACFGGEVLACALIKVFKLKEEDKAPVPTTMMSDLLTQEELDDMLGKLKEATHE